MSERTKKQTIKSSDNTNYEEYLIIDFQKKTQNHIRIPHADMVQIFLRIAPYTVTQTEEPYVPVGNSSARQAFKDLDAKYGRVGVMLRGLRSREDLTQAELAKMLHIKQTHISEMENGKRTIGKSIAQRISKMFDIDYRLFL